MSNTIGQDIRALRKSRGITLQHLAQAVGRSVGWLSQIERGQTVPAIPDLASIARVFGVTISFFFRSGSSAPEERGLVQRAGDRVAIGQAESGLSEELLSPTLGGAFEMIKSTFAPQSRSEMQHPAAPREDGGVVISGELQMTLGDLEVTLRAGDSFQFGARPYSWRNDGEVPAVVIWVIAPPIY